MRPLRNNTEYPSLEKPVASTEDVEEATAAAEGMIRMAATVIDHMPVY